MQSDLILLSISDPNWAEQASAVTAIVSSLISVVTIIFVILTFKEQRKVTKAQIVATESQLEIARAQMKINRQELMPFLQFKNEILYTNYEYESTDLVRRQQQFQVQKNCLKNLQINTNFDKTNLINVQLPGISLDRVWLPGEIVSFSISYYKSKVNEVIMFDEFHDVFLGIELSYIDMLGTCYQVKCTYEPESPINVHPACEVQDFIES